MGSTKIFAIAIAAVVVVAGVAAVLIINNESGKTNRTYASGTAGCLQVYGNANNDYYIDNSDVELIEKIIKEETDWKTDYPFADADFNGEVNSADVDFTKNIINATKENKAEANILCFTTDKVNGYVEKIKVPATAASFNYNTTTIVALMAMGIVNEFVATTGPATPSVEPVIAKDYAQFLEHKIGDRSCDVDATRAGNYIKDKEDPMTLFLFSNANTYDYYGIRPSLNNLGVGVITINDSSSDPLEYASCMLALGFIFGADGNDYVSKSVKMAEWLVDFNENYNKILEKTNAPGFVKKKAVVTSSINRVSGPQSSNTKNLKYAGLEAALTVENTESVGNSNTLNYNYQSDTWLNKIDVDMCIMLSSAYNDKWQWFSNDNTASKTTVPTNMVDGIQQFSTMKNYKNTVCTSLSYPSPFRNMLLCEIAYPDLFEGEKGAREYMQDFYHQFAGWDADCMKDYILYTTPAMIGLITE